LGIYNIHQHAGWILATAHLSEENRTGGSTITMAVALRRCDQIPFRFCRSGEMLRQRKPACYSCYSIGMPADAGFRTNAARTRLETRRLTMQRHPQRRGRELSRSRTALLQMSPPSNSSWWFPVQPVFSVVLLGPPSVALVLRS
jgi:hypothetical protein